MISASFCFRATERLKLAHATEHPRVMQHKVKLCLLGDFARSLSRLERERPKLGEEERETRVVVVRVSNLQDREVDAGLEVLERSLNRYRDEGEVSWSERECARGRRPD